MPDLPTLLILAVPLLLVVFLVYLYFRSQKRYLDLEVNFKNREDQLNRQLYEASVLEEIGERIGYSLNVTKIAEIITGSLSNIVGYSTTSYIIITPEKLVFRSSLKEAVSADFVKEVQKRMLASIMALTSNDLTKLTLDEGTSGVLTSEVNKRGVASFFNIPLVINDKVTGLINVASTSPDLYKEADMTILYKITKKASTAVSKLEAVLESEKGKLQIMVENLADGILMVDSSLQLLVINPAARSFLQLPAQGDINFYDVLKELDSKLSLRKKVEETLKFEKVMVAGELPLGNYFMQVFVSPVKSPQGLLGAALIFHDKTHEKALERLRDDFTAMMVHELRTPLSVMYATNDLIIKRVSQLSPGKLSELLNNIRDSSNELLSLVNDILDAAKVEAGKFKVTPAAGDFAQLLKEQQAFFTPEAERRHLEIKGEIEDDLPPVLFDKERISQVIRNLIGNALKFTDQGTITLKASKNGSKDEILVSVSDTGTGIPKEALDKLFNKFEQMRNPVDPKSKGTGLGLVITKGIVEAHGGKIWVESAVGQGSTFLLTLPTA